MPRTKRPTIPGPKPTFNTVCYCEKNRTLTFQKKMAKWLAHQAEWQLYLANREIIKRHEADLIPECFHWMICELDRGKSITFVCTLDDNRRVIPVTEALHFKGEPELYPLTKYNGYTFRQIKNLLLQKFDSLTFEEKCSCFVGGGVAYYNLVVTAKTTPSQPFQ